jgi:DNA polymerase III delta subunit
VKSEFDAHSCSIDDDALELFLSLVPQNFDLMATEIEKLCTYISGSSSQIITKDIIQKFIGYSEEYSPDHLMYAIVKKENGKSLEILDNLLNKAGINEIFLLSIITNYYLDLISFKTRGFASNDSYSHFGKYKMWGDRLKFAKTFHNLLDENQLRYSLLRLLETDQKLKTSMLDSKILMASLVEDLVNFS